MSHVYEAVKPKPIRYEIMLQLVRAVRTILEEASPTQSDWDYLRATYEAGGEELKRNQGLGKLIRTE